jgi:hypothetical protein
VSGLLLLAMAATALAFSVRSGRPTPPAEPPPEAVAAVKAVAPAAPRPSAAKPRPRDARKAVRRVFGQAVTLDPASPAAGDFNGDGWEDLAAVVRAAPRMLDQVNDELSNWIRQDATGPRGGRVAVGAEDVLLAVIHGHGPEGWRSAAARQSYLVRNAPSRPRATEDNAGLARAGSREPRGHVLVDDAPGRPGYLYWSGSRYVWTSLDGPAATR